MGNIAPRFLASALVGIEWLASRSDHFVSGLIADLDAVAKRKNLIIASTGNRTPVVQPVAKSLFWLSYPGFCLKVLYQNYEYTDCCYVYDVLMQIVTCLAPVAH
jgi:hypothetical protein